MASDYDGLTAMLQQMQGGMIAPVMGAVAQSDRIKAACNVAAQILGAIAARGSHVSETVVRDVVKLAIATVDGVTDAYAARIPKPVPLPSPEQVITEEEIERLHRESK